MAIYKIELNKILSIIKSVEILRDEYYHDQNTVSNIYDYLNTNKDARLTVYAKITNTINNFHLTLVYINKHLQFPRWWQESYKDLSMEDIDFYTASFFNFSKVSFFHIIFSCLESSLRILLRAIDPNVCNNGTASFESIYKCLLNSKLSGFKKEDLYLLDLIRYVRNTIHNNGIYFDKISINHSIIFKGKTYNFVHSKPVTFVDYEFLFFILDELRVIIKKIVTHQKFQEINKEITDYLPINWT